MLQPGTGGDRAAAYISVFTWRRGNRRAVLSLRALILATGCKLLTAFYPKGTGERCVEKASRRFSDKTAIVEARIHDPLLAPPPRPVPPALPPLSYPAGVGRGGHKTSDPGGPGGVPAGPVAGGPSPPAAGHPGRAATRARTYGSTEGGVAYTWGALVGHQGMRATGGLPCHHGKTRRGRRVRIW